jgi:hypothetical protein
VLDQLLERAKSLGGIWIAPLGEIAEHVHNATPPEQARPVPVVRIDDDVYGG